jgi:WD40 repeat protein
MNMEELMRETIHDLAEQARPADLGRAALTRGRRRRWQRLTAVTASYVAVAAAAVAIPVLLRGGWPAPVGAGSTYFAGNLGAAGDGLDVAISPDGELLAAAGGNTWSVTVWDAHTGEQVRILTGEAVVSTVAFSSSGGLLATGSDFWNPVTGERLSGFAGGSYDVAFSPDGTTLAAANGYLPEGMLLFDTSTGTQLRSLSSDYFAAAAFSPDGTLLAGATGYREEGAVLWRVETGEQVRVLDGGSAQVAFSPDGQLVATSGGGATQLWSPATGEHLRDLPVGVGFGFSPDGTLFAGTSDDHQVQLFDVATGNLERTLDGVYATSLAFSPDGERILIVDPNRNVRVVALD